MAKEPERVRLCGGYKDGKPGMSDWRARLTVLVLVIYAPAALRELWAMIGWVL